MILNKTLAYSETHNNLEQQANCQSQVLFINSPKTLNTPVQTGCVLGNTFQDLFQGQFPLVATSHRYFPMWQLPNCAISQSAKLTKSVLAAVTSPLQPVIASAFASPQLILAAELGSRPCQPAARLERLNLTFGKLPLGKLNIW